MILWLIYILFSLLCLKVELTRFNLFGKKTLHEEIGENTGKQENYV